MNLQQLYLESKMKQELKLILSPLRIQLGSKLSPTSIFYLKNEEVYLELNTETKELYLSTPICHHFMNQFGPEMFIYKISLTEFFQDYLESYLQIKYLNLSFKRF